MTMKRPSAWSEKTVIRLTVGLCLIVLSAVATGFWEARGAMEAMNQRFQRVEEAARASWSYPMHKEWTAELKINNPTLIIPDATAIRRDHIDANLGPRLAPAESANPIASTLDLCDPFPVQNVP